MSIPKAKAENAKVHFWVNASVDPGFHRHTLKAKPDSPKAMKVGIKTED